MNSPIVLLLAPAVNGLPPAEMPLTDTMPLAIRERLHEARERWDRRRDSLDALSPQERLQRLEVLREEASRRREEALRSLPEDRRESVRRRLEQIEQRMREGRGGELRP